MDKGILYVCSTPIGNLEDITLRVLRILKEVDLIAAEDTRHTLKLLNHYGIKKPLISYHEHNKGIRENQIIEMLLSGKNIALVSDAGMPGISDPGEDLIKKAIEHGIKIVPLPGPSAFVTALVVSGLPTNRFVFEGFLPKKKSERIRFLNILKNDSRTLIFYEAPHRLLKLLEDIYEVLGNRRIVLARELTKIHEEIFRGDVKTLLDIVRENGPKGEMVLVVEGYKGEAVKDESVNVRELVKKYMEEGLSKKEAIKKVSVDLGISKRDVYGQSLDL